jgi:hypothetical protein
MVQNGVRSDLLALVVDLLQLDLEDPLRVFQENCVLLGLSGN